jgi:hypothetical protein
VKVAAAYYWTPCFLVSNQLAEHHLAFKFHTDINQADANDEEPGLKADRNKRKPP